MTLLVYRIDEGVIGKLVNWIKKPPLPVARLAAFNLSQNIVDLLTENFYVLSDKTEIEKFEDPRGFRLEPGVYYFRHPAKVRTNWLVPTSAFHPFVVREQIADIVSFVRAELPVKRIEFEIAQGASLDAVLDGGEKVPVDGKARFARRSSYAFVLEADKPLKPSEKKHEYVWLDHFPDVKTAVDNFADGDFSITERSDVSFGLGVESAKKLGVNMDFMKEQRWSLKVSVG